MPQLLHVIGGALALATTASATSHAEFHKLLELHAIAGTLVFALFMPIGSILIRAFTFRGILWFHGGWMIFSYILSFATLGTGIWMVRGSFDDPHKIIGLVVILGCFLQPLTGLAHHLLYKKVGRPNKATYPHIWLGRALITLGAINGGLGLRLSGTSQGLAAAYAVGAGVVWTTWMGVIMVASLKSKGKKDGETGEKIFPVQSN